MGAAASGAAAASYPASCADDGGASGIPSQDRAVDEIPDLRGRSVPLNASLARRGRGGIAQSSRSTKVDDLTFNQPVSCTLTKHLPENGAPYWFGTLPPDQHDDQGRHTRRLTWGFHAQRSESETITLIEDWLQTNYKPPV